MKGLGRVKAPEEVRNERTYERIEGDLRADFIANLSGDEAREDLAHEVTELVGGEHDEKHAYAEGFVRAYFREAGSGYEVDQGIPGVELPEPRLNKHIQNGWINGRNTRLAAQA